MPHVFSPSFSDALSILPVWFDQRDHMPCDLVVNKGRSISRGEEPTKLSLNEFDLGIGLFRDHDATEKSGGDEGRWTYPWERRNTKQ